MYIPRIVGDFAGFFYALRFRIICIIRGIIGRIDCAARGGVNYWRGNVFAGGINQKGLAGVEVEQSGGAQGGGVGQGSSVHGLIHGLAGDAKGGGASGGAGESFNKLGNQGVLHGGIRKARRRVSGWPASGACQMETALVRQVVVDAPETGQSVFSMPLRSEG